MNNVLDSDPTDLVVLNGDLITGDATNLKNKTTLVEKLVEPMVKRGLFWASTYGNHDHSKTLAARNIMERERHYPGARTTSMVSGDDVGVSNYYLPVYASNCTTEKGDPGRLSSSCPPSLILWFFDSRGGEYYDRTGSDGKPVQQPNWVHPDVAHWFRRTSVRLRRANGGQVIPSIAFVHIPTNASNLIQPKVKPDRNPGVNDEAPGLQQSASGM
ncbi:metallophosphoesterase [Purpureocillium lavendulum]|uniref:Metallophosphoesterase n=1 Tax=Purpureocillium lavendulum TaxID=1247861 RepID=A0AB34G857_9HYPO|nr:metallophosphoesterase [Purpureocillium lavendulum]